MCGFKYLRGLFARERANFAELLHKFESILSLAAAPANGCLDMPSKDDGYLAVVNVNS